jgi:hypothetical protein
MSTREARDKIPSPQGEPSQSVCKTKKKQHFALCRDIVEASLRCCFYRCAENEPLKRDLASEHLRHESRARQIFDGKFDGTRIMALRYQMPSPALDDFVTVTWTRSRRL